MLGMQGHTPRSRRWRGVLVVSVIGALGAVAAAQAPQPPTAPDRLPAADVGTLGTRDPAPVFRSGVTLVTTDVIVRDGEGIFLPDLTEDDFTIFEDDVARDVASLVLVHGGRVYNQLLPPPPVQEGIILPPSRPVNDTAGRVFVIVIDDLHIEANKTPKTRQVFEKMFTTLIHEGDLYGVVTTGPSSIRIDLNYDRSQLYSAMERIVGDGFNATELITDIAQGPRGPEELRWRAHVAFKTVRDLVRNLEQVRNRRKAIIYFSQGYDFNPFEDERIIQRDPMAREMRDSQGRQRINRGYQMEDMLYDPFQRMEREGVVFSDVDLAMELAELAKAANRANATFYTVDPRGLMVGPDVDYKGPIEEFNEWLYQTQSSLRTLAELTGGKAVVNSNNFEGLFKEIDAETSDYYVLGFYSGNADPTARTRRLRVEVDRDDVDVQSRTHYTYERAGVQAALPPRP